ncbi:MAG: glycoside hydrolase family 127 protein [Lachnospiraceae bacterium]|nr:glycoside hydrolase family 127 protein [Lachnospiraceae bacterium]
MKTNGKINEIGIAQVSLTEPYLTNALELEIEYLTSFDPDRWLAGFRETAGLDMRGKQRYGGWEDSLIAGHAFGHYLGACAYAYASPDVSPADKDKLFRDISYIVDELKVCQDNSKGKPGFLFCANIIDADNVEKQFDNVEVGKVNIITEAWVPWYTMHKLIQGLVDVYNFMGLKSALAVAEGLGDWTYNRASGWSQELNAKVLTIEYGGMNDCLYELYAATGNEKYAVAAHKFDEVTLFEKVLSGEKNALTNRHANTTIPKFIGALKRYYYLNGETDASKYLEYAKAFFEMVRDRHTYITGGNSEWEHFGEDDVLDKERTNCNNETCNIHNMLKLSRLLFMISGDRCYADFYENAYINSILASQNPETGMTMYFQPMSTGYFKVYGERYNKFWCCTGTGMENFTKLGDSIYFEDENGVYINMYLSSEMKSRLHDFTLIQDSKVMELGGAEFTVAAASELKLNLYFRIPDWADGEPAVLVNGERVQYKSEKGFATVTGPFNDGDRIALTIPMAMKAYPL